MASIAILVGLFPSTGAVSSCTASFVMIGGVIVGVVKTEGLPL